MTRRVVRWLTLCLALALAACAVTSPKPAPRFANHELWEREIEAAEAALKSGDLTAAQRHALAMAHESVHLEPSDPRDRRSNQLLSELLPKVFDESPQQGMSFSDALIAISDRETGPASRSSIAVSVMVGFVLAQHDQLEKAADIELRVRKQSEGQPELLSYWMAATFMLVRIRGGQERFDEAAELARSAREQAERQQGPEGPMALQGAMLEVWASISDHPADAEALLVRIAPAMDRLGSTNPDLWTNYRLASGVVAQRRYRFEQSRDALAEVIDSLRGIAQPDDARLLQAYASMASAQYLLGDWQAAEENAERCASAAQQSFAKKAAPTRSDRNWVVICGGRLAELALYQDRPAQARTALGVAREELGSFVEPKLTAHESAVEAAAGDAKRSEQLARQAQEEAQAQPLKTRDRTWFDFYLGRAAVLRKDFSQGDAALRRALAEIDAGPAPCDDQVVGYDWLGRALEGQGKLEEADAAYVRGEQGGAACFGDTARVMEQLERDRGALLAKLGRADESKQISARVERIVAAKRAFVATTDSDRIELPDLNLSFRKPKAPWGRSHPDKDWNITFLRRSPAMRLQVAARELGPNGPTTDQVVAGMLKTLPSGEDPVVISRKPLTLANVAGVEHEIVIAKSGQVESHQVLWIGARGGFYYTLVASAPAQDAAKLSAEAELVFAGFAPLDPTRVSHLNAQPDTFRSDRFHYSLRLAGSQLFPITQKATLPFDYAGGFWDTDPRRARLVVASVSLSGIHAERGEIERAARRLLYGDVEYGAARAIDAGGVSGSEFSGTLRPTASARALSVRARVFVRSSSALAIGVAVETAAESDVESLLRMVERLSPDKDDAAVELASFDADEKLRNGFFYNNLGLDALEHQQYPRAVPFFEKALACLPTHRQIAENLEGSRLRANLLEETVSGVTRDLESFPDDAVLHGLRGTAYARLGKLDEAEADLKRALDLGGPSDEAVGAYVDVLIRKKEYDTALQELDVRIAQSGTPTLRALRAFTLDQAGRADEAKEELRALVRMSPDDPVTRRALMDAELVSGDHQGFLAVTDPLVKEEPTVTLFWLRALAQEALGQRKNALDSLDQALKLEPDSDWLIRFREHLAQQPGAGGAQTL
jgi:tetratricopeptide (TPR) repeat protein